MLRYCVRLLLAILLMGDGIARAQDASVPFRIQILDDQTGRGVPLVRLETVNNICFYTDSQGIAAIDDPDLEGRDVFFRIGSHGYEYPQDGFGIRGERVRVTRGAATTFSLKRINIAERLYRLTGAAIYRDSLLTGAPAPIPDSQWNGQVVGCDSTISEVYHGKLFWFWGDTNRLQYPLGNFQSTGATSPLPSRGGLDPAVGVELTIFTGKEGFARGMAEIPGDGASWLSGLTVLKDDATGRERMLAGYVRVRPPFDVYNSGLAEYDDATETFRSIAEFGKDPVVSPCGHPILLRTDGVDHVYFGNTIPFIRAPARVESLRNLGEYEAYTCLKAGNRLDDPEIERAADGAPIYAWKRDTPPIGPEEFKKLVANGVLKPHEGLFRIRDRDTGRAVRPHFGSCYWNDYLRKFVFVFVESEGETSLLGEVWCTLGDSPTGPWAYAVKIITHNHYTFYNPKQHPAFAQQGGRIIYFDGTYSHTFSGYPEQTPRYDYNTIMYRLDLGDPRMTLPVAVYRSSNEQTSPLVKFAPASANESAAGIPDRSRIAFFACNRLVDGLVPVYTDPENAAALTLKTPAGRQPAIAFYAVPADAESPPTATTPL
ncbi:MAG: hypothetical protein JNG89_00610, partial [Planctomycetaceae bacterium]|nr:hypothetical protein [Planctomycetaceae bacterium]